MNASTQPQSSGWAVVTGASRGLGEAFARELAARGTDVALVGLEGDRLEQLAARLAHEHGVACRAVEQDLSADGAVEQVCTALADLDIQLLVNNAGIGCGGPFATRDAARLEALVQLNCRTPVLLTRALIPAMLSRGRGGVILVSSLMGLVSAPEEAAYCGSKAFLLHFGEALWGELRGTGVDVLVACPAGMRTEFYATDGLSADSVARLYRVSDPPERVARWALDALGRKPTTAAFPAWLAGFLSRLAPRRLCIIVTGWFMRLFADYR